MKQHRAYKWEVLALLWVAYLLNQADRQVFNTVLPAIRDSLGLTDTSVGLIATIFNLFYACMVPLGGWAGDRFSRKWVTTLSILFWSVATMFTGLANGVVMLVLMRSVATGGGEAFFGPANYSLLGQYHTDTRARAMSIHQTSYYVGVILAGWLAGKIADSLGWKYSFIIFGAAGILWGIVMILRLRDYRDDRGTDAGLVQPGTAVPDAESFTPSGECIQNCSTSLQSPAESTATETASAQQLTKVSGTAQAGDCRQTESCRQHSPEGVKLSTAGNSLSAGTKPAGEAPAAAKAQLNAKPGLLDGFKTVFTTPTALALTLGFSAFIFVITGYMTWVPAYLQEEFGQNQEMAGLHSMLWTYIAAFIGVLLAGTLSDKLGARDHKTRMYIQGAGLLLGAGFLFFMGADTALWVLYLCFAGWGFFRAFFDANIYTVLYDVTPERLHASCSSAMITTGFAVGALAPVILGAMKESLGSLRATFPMLGLIWAVVGIALFIVARHCYQKDYDKIHTI